jgi:hypothetical protein
MMDHLIQFFDKFTVTAWILMLTPFALAGCIFLIRRYVKHTILKSVLYFIAVLFLLRVSLYYNPVSWASYRKLLPLKSIDWRHYDVMICETNKYLKPERNLKYMAVGSSQTSVIFGLYASRHDNFSVFALAGLSPLDLYTYRKEIVRQKPEYLIMYLCEFDIARKPELASSKWSPFSLRDIDELRKIIDTTSCFTKEDRQILYDLVGGKYFPEYKYSFVFKDLSDVLLYKNELLNLTAPTQIADSVYLDIHLKSLNELSEKYIPFNMYYLRKSIQYLNKKNIRVIFVEGQYNPLAYTPYTQVLNKQVRALLLDFITTNPVNRFVPREKEPEFVLEDYKDGYHVKDSSGLRFAETVIEQLDSLAF